MVKTEWLYKYNIFSILWLSNENLPRVNTTLIFQIYSQVFKGDNMDAKGSFVIDESIGNQLEIELNYVLPDYTNPKMVITFQNETILDEEIDQSASNDFFSVPGTMKVTNLKIFIFVTNRFIF